MMTGAEELENLARRIVRVREGKLVSPEIARIGDRIFASDDPVGQLASLIPLLPGICADALFLSNLSHMRSLRKGDYQRLFNALRDRAVATYNLTKFLVHYAGVRGPVLRELGGDNESFRDIAKHQMENAILGDGLAQEPTIFFFDGRPPQDFTLEWCARCEGRSAAEELAVFREDIKAALS